MVCNSDLEYIKLCNFINHCLGMTPTSIIIIIIVYYYNNKIIAET